MTSSVAICLATHTSECIGSTTTDAAMSTRSVTAAAAERTLNISRFR